MSEQRANFEHGKKMDGLFMSGEAVRDVRDATLADECLSSCLLQPRDKQSAEPRRPKGVLSRQTDGRTDWTDGLTTRQTNG